MDLYNKIARQSKQLLQPAVSVVMRAVRNPNLSSKQIGFIGSTTSWSGLGSLLLAKWRTQTTISQTFYKLKMSYIPDMSCAIWPYQIVETITQFATCFIAEEREGKGGRGLELRVTRQPRSQGPLSTSRRSENGDVSGAGENTLRRLALFVYLDHPTKNDVTSGKKVSWAGKSNFNMA